MPPSFKLVVASQSKQSGLVVAAHGRRGILETQDGQIIRYLVKGRHLRVVCGDRVTWAGQKYDRAAMVTNLLPRDNMLERMPPGRNDVEILAANLTCVVVVVAPIPKPDWFLTPHLDFLWVSATMAKACSISSVVIITAAVTREQIWHGRQLSDRGRRLE